MKSAKKIIGLILLSFFIMVGSTNVNAIDANQDSKMKVKMTLVDNNQKVKIHLYNLLDQPTKIRVRDNTGKVLYRENIKNSPGFSIELDFSRIPLGNYTISVEQESSIITHHMSNYQVGLAMIGVESWKYQKYQEPIKKDLADITH